MVSVVRAAVNDEPVRNHDVIVTVRALADQLRRRVRKSDKLPEQIWSWMLSQPSGERQSKSRPSYVVLKKKKGEKSADR